MSDSHIQSRWATELAPDVVGEILLESIPFAQETRFLDGETSNPGPRAMFPIALSHVCRQWRQAAINFKKLWSFLDVDQDDDDTVRLELYLARSGQYPLTIILTYPYTGHEHAILGRLLRESSRWRTFFCDVYGLFDASPRSTGLTHAQWTALAFPELKNVVYFNSGHTRNAWDEEEDWDDDSDSDSDDDSFGTDDGTNDPDEGDGDLPYWYTRLLNSLPGTVAAQLRRFYSYCIDDEFAEEMPSFLKRATRIRCDFISTNTFLWEEFNPGLGTKLLSLPHAEYAMLATGDIEMSPSRSFLFRNQLPNLRGLNLRVGWEGRDAFIPWENVSMPEYLTKLVVLRLCGTIVMADGALTQILSSLSSLVDFTLELHRPGDVNIAHLANLLTPQLPTIRVPRLEHLRLFLRHEPSNNTLVPMLVARFTAPAGAPYSKLRSFTLYYNVISSGEVIGVPGTLIMQLGQLKGQHGWDIRVVEYNKFQGTELWLEPLNGEFMLDI